MGIVYGKFLHFLQNLSLDRDSVKKTVLFREKICSFTSYFKNSKFEFYSLDIFNNYLYQVELNHSIVNPNEMEPFPESKRCISFFKCRTVDQMEVNQWSVNTKRNGTVSRT